MRTHPHREPAHCVLCADAAQHCLRAQSVAAALPSARPCCRAVCLRAQSVAAALPSARPCCRAVCLRAQSVAAALPSARPCCRAVCLRAQSVAAALPSARPCCRAVCLRAQSVAAALPSARPCCRAVCLRASPSPLLCPLRSHAATPRQPPAYTHMKAHLQCISGNQAVLYKGEYKVVTRSNGHDDGPGTFVLLRVELPHLIAHMKLRVGSMAQHQHDMLSLEAFRGERFPGDPNQIIFDVPHNSFRFWCTPETDSLELNRQILTDLHKKYRPQDALSALLQAELYDHQAQQPNAAAFIDMAPRPAANSRDQKEGGLQEQKQKYPWRSDAIDSLEGSAGPEHVFAEKKGHAHVKPEVGRGEDNALREGTGSSPQRQSKEQRQNKKGQLGLPESNRNMLATGAKAMAGQHLDDSSGKQHISQECKLEAGENVSKNKADKTESSQKKAVRKKNRRRKKQMA
eukprot:g61488.t1